MGWILIPESGEKPIQTPADFRHPSWYDVTIGIDSMWLHSNAGLGGENTRQNNDRIHGLQIILMSFEGRKLSRTRSVMNSPNAFVGFL